jgi:hypothetical protein
MTCDIVIRGGTVFDGGGRIAAIASGISDSAPRLIDAEGLAVDQ